MNLIGKTLWVQNAALSFPSNTWMSCGLPENSTDGPVEAVDSLGTVFPVVLDGNELFVRVPLTGGQKKSLTLRTTSIPVALGTRTGSQGTTLPIATANWATDDLRQIVPTFRAVYNSMLIEAPAIAVVRTRVNAARLRVEFKTRFVECPLFVHGWVDVFDNQEIVEFKLLLSWGSTDGSGANNSAGLLGAVTMHTQEQIFIDNWRNKGLTQPSFNGTTWSAKLADPATWANRTGLWEFASGIRICGALRCLPPQSEWGPAMLADQRYLDARHREQGKAYCMLDKEHWKGYYGAFGAVPVITQTAARSAYLNTFYTAVYNRSNSVDNENHTHFPLFNNAPLAGATGTQADFGASQLVACIGYNEPGALHWYQRDLDTWFRRPYHYKDASGTYIHQKGHANTRTYGAKPHTQGTDLMGYTLVNGGVPTPWWSNADEQHRCENLTMQMYLLTRDPTIEPVVRNLIQLDKMAYWKFLATPPVGGNVANPRGWGRPLMTLCHYYHAGFKEAEKPIREMVARMWNDAAFRLPANAGKPMTPLSTEQYDYSYVHSVTGLNIYGVSPWQEAIAIMGLFAAYRLFPDLENARTMIVNAGYCLVNYLIYDYQGTLQQTYVYGWNGGDPWPQQYLYPQTAQTPNDHVKTSNSFWIWTRGAIAAYHSLSPDPRAAYVLSVFGTSFNVETAQWYATVQQPEL